MTVKWTSLSWEATTQALFNPVVASQVPVSEESNPRKLYTQLPTYLIPLPACPLSTRHTIFPYPNISCLATSWDKKRRFYAVGCLGPQAPRRPTMGLHRRLEERLREHHFWYPYPSSWPRTSLLLCSIQNHTLGSAARRSTYERLVMVSLRGYVIGVFGRWYSATALDWHLF